MSRYHSYIASASQILGEYDGREPFAGFLKRFFSLHKKYGSRDRKLITHLCYSYFRVGKMNFDIKIAEKIMLGLFLCSNQSNEVLLQLRPEWNNRISLPAEEKLLWLRGICSAEDIFPFINELSEGIDGKTFTLSHLKQPDVFLRLRPGKEVTVKDKLKDAGINYKVINDACLAVPNASKIDKAVALDEEAVIQDLSSQATGDFLKSNLKNPGHKMKVWDCCAASGGKSIMLYDIYPGIDLTVSDTRESILINLEKRFQKAGIPGYKSFVADLSTPDFRFPGSNLQLIMCDSPCTGSGTWSRTPEQLYYFEREKIHGYASLQKKIVSGVIPYLTPGGYFFYITCSVFKKENEEIIQFIQQNFPLHLVKMEILKGYDKKADTMFVALLQLPL